MLRLLYDYYIIIHTEENSPDLDTLQKCVPSF